MDERQCSAGAAQEQEGALGPSPGKLKFIMRKLLSLFLVAVLGTPGMARNLESRSATEIEAVRVVPNGDKTEIVVKLTGSVSPRVVIASNPDRLVLELPNTTSHAKQQHIAVNQEGMTLTVQERKAGGRVPVADEKTAVAELRVISVAETSAVTEIHGAKGAVKPGDWAYLSAEETETLVQKRASGSGRTRAAMSAP